MKLTKDQFKEALLSYGILKGRNLEMLSLIFNAPNCHATDLQLAEVLGYTDTAPINALINKLGKRIALYHNLTPCLLYTSPSPRDATLSRMPSSA